MQRSAVALRGRAAARAALALAAVGCALLAVAMAAPPAPALGINLPLQLKVTVVPPNGSPGPRPRGRISVALDNHQLLSLPLLPGLEPLTSITPQIIIALKALGHRVTISYSGDSNYEASTGIVVTIPLLKITARPKDTAPPAIEIHAPADGARYARGDTVVATYSCRDPDDRSAVTTCEGPVASGSAVDTASPGTFSFAVRAEDALGNAASKTVMYEVAGQTGGPASSPPGRNPGRGGGGSQSPPPPPAPPPPVAPPPVAPPVVTPPVVTPNVVTPPAGAVQRPSRSSARSSPRRRTSSSPPGSSGGVKQRRPAPPAGPAKPVAPKRVRQELAPYDPRSEPAKTIGILVAAFTLLQLGTGTGGLALARGAGGVARTAPRNGSSREARREHQQAAAPPPEFAYEGADIEFLGAGLGTVALGDRSRTWSWPGTRTLDAIGASLPVRLARRSPLLARIAADGTYLRAILGSASLVVLIAGLALGVAAVQDTGGQALPPAPVLTIAIAALGVLDAAAGLMAVLTFAIGVLLLGGVDSSADVRIMLSLGSLWFVVPVLAGAARPLRRPPTRSLEESWDRAADFVIASLIGAWAVQRIILALPGLAGLQLPIAEHASTAAFCVLAALVVRLGAETIASHLYPQRLDTTEAGEVPQPGGLQRLGASLLRTGLFLFFAYIVVGTSWQLWVGAALFVTPQILGLYEERFPNSPGLYRALPKGLVQLVLMLFVGTAVGALLLRTMDQHASTFLADSFVLLSVPGFVLSLLSLFGREGDQPPIGWGKRIAGIVILVAGILLVLGLLL